MRDSNSHFAALLSNGLCAVGESIEIIEHRGKLRAVLPVDDRYGDPLMLSISEEGGKIRLSDDGFVEMETAARVGSPESSLWDSLDSIRRSHGLEEGFEISAGPGAELGEAMLSLMSAVSEALAASYPHIKKPSFSFIDEVELFFEDSGVRFERKAEVPGASGTQRVVDFYLRNGAPHIVQAAASETSLRRALLIFYDVRELDSSIKPIVFLDEEKAYTNDTFQQLAHIGNYYWWRDRNEFATYWKRVTIGE